MVKIVSAAVLTLVTASAPANEVEMMLVPKASAEQIVRDHLDMQKALEVERAAAAVMRQRLEKLQSSSNCS